MLRILSSFWKSLGFLMFLLGVFWLPKDMEDYGEAAKPWQRAMAMFDQTTALWAIVGALMATLIWSEGKAFIRDRRLRATSISPANPSQVIALKAQFDEALHRLDLLANAVEMWRTTNYGKGRPELMLRMAKAINDVRVCFPIAVSADLSVDHIASLGQAASELGYQIGIARNENARLSSAREVFDQRKLQTAARFKHMISEAEAGSPRALPGTATKTPQ